MAGVNFLLVWKLVTLRSFGDTGLQGALYTVAGHVAGAVAQAQLLKRSSFAQADSRKNL